MSRMRAACVLLVAVAACGGGSGSAGATFSGAVKGQTLSPKDSISSPATVLLPIGGTAGVAAIVLGDDGALCTKVTANTEPRNGKALILLLADVNPNLIASAPAGTGTFTVYDFSAGLAGGLPPAHAAVVSFGVDDASCVQDDTKSATGKSGSVTLTRNSGGSYAGSYEVTFDSGDHVTGTFGTTACPGLADYLRANTHSCG